MTSTAYPAPAPPVNLYPTGQPLTERVSGSVVRAERSYAWEFTAASGEQVYGCYDAKTFEPLYALETVYDNRIGEVVTSCNCEDCRCRKRTCKHAVGLAVILGTGLRTPSGSLVVAASALTLMLSQPQTVLGAFEDWQNRFESAVVTATILTAAAAEEAEQARRPVVTGFDPSDWR